MLERLHGDMWLLVPLEFIGGIMDWMLMDSITRELLTFVGVCWLVGLSIGYLIFGEFK